MRSYELALVSESVVATILDHSEERLGESARERARTPRAVVEVPRHSLIYRQRTTDLVQVARILHEVIDMRRQLPTAHGR